MNRRDFLKGGFAAVSSTALSAAALAESGKHSGETLGTKPLGVTVVAERSPAVFAEIGPICRLLQRYGDRHPDSWLSRPKVDMVTHPNSWHIGGPHFRNFLDGMRPISMRSTPPTLFAEDAFGLGLHADVSTLPRIEADPAKAERYFLDGATATALFALSTLGGWLAPIKETNEGLRLDYYLSGRVDSPVFKTPKRLGVMLFNTDTAFCASPEGERASHWSLTHEHALRSIGIYLPWLKKEAELIGPELSITLLAIGIGKKPVWEMLQEGEVSEHFLRDNAINVASGAEAAEFLRSKIAA